jgi:ribonucleotide reductase alpha subunit
MQNTNNRGGVAGEPRFPADEMYVTKRDGQIEIVSFDKILRRIKSVGTEVGIKINYTSLAMKVIDQLYDKISTAKIDELTAEQCASMSSIHYDYGTLAARVAVSNHHKNTDPSFTNVINRLYNFLDKNGNHSPLVFDDLHRIANQYEREIQDALDFSRDYLFDYFGFKTLEKSYLMRINGQIVERPQHMWMRVSLGIHCTKCQSSNSSETEDKEQEDINKAIESYHMMSQKYFTHATPTLFNSGTPRPQMSSCYLIAMENDSIDGIYNTLKDCALISKWAGGIGLHIHNVRATNSHIRGTNGTSNGIVPMLRVFNNTAKYVDQCLHPDTIVYCKDGPKPINDIVPGDEVINDDGQFRPVAKVLDYPDYKGPLYTIQVGDSTIRATDMHPFWTELGEWIDAKDLQIGTKIGFPVSQYECDYIHIKPEDCVAYGMLYGTCDGNKCYYNGSNKAFLSKYFNTSNTDEFELDNGHLLNAYNLSNLWPAMLHLPKNKTQALLDGFMCNNGNENIIKYLQLRIAYSKTEYYPVTAISFDPEYKGRVIDIEVQTNDKTHHNFLTHCGLVHNGGGRRHGSFAIYLEPWHADIEKFLEMRKNHGDEELKARDLFYALWIPDLFMERVKADSTWTLMCPDECPGLADVYGPEFTALYSKYESEGKGRATIKARDLWLKVLDAQMETGTPYLCYKDASNQKSNQKNIGTIKSSNLCVAPETLVLTDQGNQRIDTLVGKKVNVWNGEEWSEVEVFKTGTNRPLMCVTTDANNTLYCTESHKFYLEDGNQINAVNLKTGDRLQPLNNIVQTVLSVSGVIRHDDTYCFTEPKRHMGVFNGILTGQCTEINEVSTPDETAVCNLASIGLPTFIEYKGKGGNCVASESEGDAFAKPTFNYEKLKQIAKVVTNNLNRVIDVNYYPTQKTQTSNLKHRPIGIGVQGLADVYALLDMPFYSDEAKEINKRIFETIYYGALEQSMELAKEEGPYETFQGSPASQGILQFDMWQKGITDAQSQEHSSSLDWASLKANIVKYGLRNSLLIAPMPTASTSQILGFNECFEPFTSNIYSRRTLAGEFILTNKYLMKELIAQGLWNTELKNNIIANQGSIQHITTLSEHMRNKYKTVWEIPMRHIIDMAADRGQYICQSQSMNLWQEDPTYASLTSMHFYAWQKGLKTGIYYLRRRAKHRAQQFTIEPKKEEECLMCSA